MWVLIYELLTQAIIILGELRTQAIKNKGHVILKGRTFCAPLKDGDWGFIEECCDCGLMHRVFLKGNNQYGQPLRPKDYEYKLRKLAAKPAEHKDVSEWRD